MAPQHWRARFSIVNNWSQRTKSPNNDPHVARAPPPAHPRKLSSVVPVHVGVKSRASRASQPRRVENTRVPIHHHHLELTRKSGPSEINRTLAPAAAEFPPQYL